ncbi:MAG TPA: hypothetical protein VFY25_06770 [Anaerolineales bacterium]|nr:hypothetical protein [Anaerolineales bacterium]
MRLTSKSLAVILFVILFGGIAFSSVMGWWVTESKKVPVAFSEGEFAGQANPADIRGSYTFGEISNSFRVTPDVLAEAFGIPEGDPGSFEVKSLETLYLDSEYEVGTASIRLFVAYYTGLPFDTTQQDIFLPQSAADILLTSAQLTPEQIVYLEEHTIPAGEVLSTALPVASAVSATGSAYTIKGKTTFGELVAWGVPQTAIEEIIGASLPDAAMTLKDYAAANELEFETLKPALQTELDKLKP